MGWASYYEKNLEIADDRAFMAARRDSRVPPRIDPAPIKLAPIIIPKSATVSVSAPNSAQIAERSRRLLDVHILCLAEMRPRNNARWNAHA
jgi:hypothetical protein